MSDYINQVIRYSVDADGVALLVWDMEGHNANIMNDQSLAAFEAAIERVVADPAVKGAVMSSAKRGIFIAGADLKQLESIAFGAKDPVELNKSLGELGRVIRKMETCGKPFAVAIEGAAMGGGLEICLGAHYRVMVDDARTQIGLPESQLGLLPGAGGTQRLPRLIGLQAAMGLLTQGTSLNAAKAKELGVVHALAPAGEVVEAARQWILTVGDPVAPWDKKNFRIPGGGMENPNHNNMMMVSVAMFRANTYGNYPAGVAIMACIAEGVRVPLDVGLDIERRYFVQLLVDPTAGNMVRTNFLSMEKLKKLHARPADVPKAEIKKVGILGAGTMGAGIAYCCANAKLEAVLLDRSLEAAEKGRAYTEKLMDRKIKKGRSTEEKKQELLNRIKATVDYADLADCDIVVEAVFEDRGIKAKVTQATEAVVSSKCIIGSNTSALPITELAQAIENRSRFIGMHFFSPADRMQLVEVICGKETSQETLAHTLDFVQRIGKIPIIVNDSPGFYTSRVIGTYITEGIAMMADGVKPALIENAGRMAGMPMAPLTVADSIGLDLMVQAGVQRKADLGDKYVESPATPVLLKLVEGAGRHGMKNGKGFFDYAEDRSKKLWSGLSELFPSAATQPSVQEIKDRFLYVQCIEAARCIAEGVIDDPAQMDVGAIMGIGFAPHTGGPMSYIDTVGVAAFVKKADELASKFGARFEVPAFLREMAEKGETIYGRFGK